MRTVPCPHCHNEVDVLVSSAGHLTPDSFMAARAKVMLAGEACFSICHKCGRGFWWSLSSSIKMETEMTCGGAAV